MYERIISAIESHDKIIIHRHSNPDGDALGAQIGLCSIIRATYPDKTVRMVGDMSRRYAFMDGSDMDEIDDGEYDGALAIILDTAASSLVSDTRYSLAAERLRIDHHIFCEKFADIEFVDTTFESCAGFVAYIAMTEGLTVDDFAAKALYTGMVTDSGRFRYDSTNSRTFEIASFLLKRNFSTASIYSELYADELKMVKMRASFIMRIQTTSKGVGYIYTTADEVKLLDADTFTISRGMVNTMSDIRGINSWVNFTETDDGILCEIRSKKYNINPIAVKHGGGGHAKASGATLRSREEAMNMLDELDALEDGNE